MHIETKNFAATHKLWALKYEKQFILELNQGKISQMDPKTTIPYFSNGAPWCIAAVKTVVWVVAERCRGTPVHL